MKTGMGAGYESSRSADFKPERLNNAFRASGLRTICLEQTGRTCDREKIGSAGRPSCLTFAVADESDFAAKKYHL
jgi:hypothetical protein